MLSLLARIAAVYPDSLTVAPEPGEIDLLWEGGFIDLWDSWPNGRRRMDRDASGDSMVERSEGRERYLIVRFVEIWWAICKRASKL